MTALGREVMAACAPLAVGVHRAALQDHARPEAGHALRRSQRLGNPVRQTAVDGAHCVMSAPSPSCNILVVPHYVEIGLGLHVFLCTMHLDWQDFAHLASAMSVA